jgi:hypothetical protein
MRFLNRSEVRPWFEGRRVAIVGSGPGCDENSEGWVDSHEVVVRVNNFKTTARTGKRTDVFYSFFGTSIRKTSEELIRGGVKLCMSKVPNAHAIESEWHRRHGKMIGVDYRPHYERRKDWWFCDTYVPTVEEFLQPFNALERHQPTSGFAAIWDVLSFDPASVFLTGFDFFRSGIHNVNEPWMVKNTDDPIRHEPELERKWVADAVKRHSIRCDKRLADAIA